MTLISVIIPCYFNEANISVTGRRLIENEINFDETYSFEYIFVDDGSKDKTWDELIRFQSKHPDKIKVIKLSRNFSSTNAVYAALQYAEGDCNIVISADLQDPPELFSALVKNWQSGFKIVVANRVNREEPLLQKILSNLTHALIQRFAIKDVPKGGFDMNLFDREIRDRLIAMEDRNSFFPYLLMWLGFEYVTVPYIRRKREIGKSTYTLGKKVTAFIDSFVAFSYFPIRAISAVGILLGLIGFVYGGVILVTKVAGGVSVDGWSSLMLIILLVSGFQLTAIGIIGEYLWRTLDASRKRPGYIIEKIRLPENRRF
jgi:dolichol-phosphate mannosyltransferase